MTMLDWSELVKVDKILKIRVEHAELVRTGVGWLRLKQTNRGLGLIMKD